VAITAQPLPPSFTFPVVLYSQRVYIADTFSRVIRLMTPVPQVPVTNSGGIITAANFDVSGSVADPELKSTIPT
jgi:hypothetical protein